MGLNLGFGAEHGTGWWCFNWRQAGKVFFFATARCKKIVFALVGLGVETNNLLVEVANYPLFLLDFFVDDVNRKTHCKMMVGGTLNRQSSDIWFGGFNVATSTDRLCLRKGQIWNKNQSRMKGSISTTNFDGSVVFSTDDSFNVSSFSFLSGSHLSHIVIWGCP